MLPTPSESLCVLFPKTQESLSCKTLAPSPTVRRCPRTLQTTPQGGGLELHSAANSTHHGGKLRHIVRGMVEQPAELPRPSAGPQKGLERR